MNAKLPILVLAATLTAATLAAVALSSGAFDAARAAGHGVVFHSQRVTLPYPGPHFTGKGAVMLNTSCITCHSADFVNGQPHLPLATWKVEVLKMKNAFHAPVEEKNVNALAEILFERHPAPAK